MWDEMQSVCVSFPDQTSTVILRDSLKETLAFNWSSGRRKLMFNEQALYPNRTYVIYVLCMFDVATEMSGRVLLISVLEAALSIRCVGKDDFPLPPPLLNNISEDFPYLRMSDQVYVYLPTYLPTFLSLLFAPRDGKLCIPRSVGGGESKKEGWKRCITLLIFSLFSHNLREELRMKKGRPARPRIPS